MDANYVVNKGLYVSGGLFLYPVLMAADILLYGAKWVPVGEDQRQHLELARDLAIRINNKFGEVFTVPNEWSKQLEFIGIDKGTRIRSLKHPERKMSKSVDDPSGTIMLSDNPDDAKQKVMSATTDSIGVINFDWEKQPGVANLLQMLALTSNKSQDEVNQQWVGKTSYGDLKSAVAEAVAALLSEVQDSLTQVDEADIVSKLTKDESIMRETANATLLKVQKAVGLRN
jgi:tryptophanyl-tRNA synthetase